MKRRKMFWVVLMVLVLGITGCGKDLPKLADVTGTVELQTFEEEVNQMFYTDGYSVSKVILDGQETVLTSYDGKFTFKNVPVGQHTIELKHSLFTSQKLTINVLEEGTHVTLTGTVDGQNISTTFSDDGKLNLGIWVAKYFEGANNIRIKVTDSLVVSSWVSNVSTDSNTNEYVISNMPGYEGMFNFYVNESNPTSDSYNLEYKFCKDDTVLETVTKTFALSQTQINDPDLTNPKNPVLSWVPLTVQADQVVSYYIHVRKFGDFNYWELLLSIETAEAFHEIVNDLEPGEYYYEIKAHVYDDTGYYLATYSSQKKYFTITY